MKEKKKGYLFLRILTIIFTLAAISSTLPILPASKDCMLGYRAHCSFTPVSTLICIVAAGVVCTIRKRKFTVRN
ncbi:hypothetical protein ACFL6S_25560 [Candidatus Poribacteria bacterium]